VERTTGDGVRDGTPEFSCGALHRSERKGLCFEKEAKAKKATVTGRVAWSG
jgi:hypothetical protein